MNAQRNQYIQPLKELLARLDPSMLEFIRKRRYVKGHSDSNAISNSKQAKLIPNQVFRTETGSEVTLPSGMSNFIERNIDKIDEKWKEFAR